jgi:hypothetical protein
MKNPIYMLLNLLDLCRCSKIHPSTTHIHPLSQNYSTLPMATKMASLLLRGMGDVQAKTLPSAATVGLRKLVMREYHLKHIF